MFVHDFDLSKSPLSGNNYNKGNVFKGSKKTNVAAYRTVDGGGEIAK